MIKIIIGTCNEEKKKADRCTRIAKRKYDVWPSAYASGAVVKCRKGKIWKGVKESISNDLSRLAISDQKLRSIWADWLDQRGGWSKELVDEFAKQYGTSKEDLFNDAPTQKEFKKIFSMISDEDFSQFTDKDWDSFHIIVQHMDNDIETQKKARDILNKFNRTEQYEYLDDRINCAELGKQLYGTQNGCEKVDTLQESQFLEVSEEELLEVIIEEVQKYLDEKKKKKPDFKKEKESGLHGWFSRQGGKGKSKGWVDCNTCRKDKKTGRKTCKTCGRQKGEKRAKYPSCRPKPSDCGSSGKGKEWGKKSKKKG